MNLEGNMGKAIGKMQTRGFQSLSERTSLGQMKRNDGKKSMKSTFVEQTLTNNRVFAQLIFGSHSLEVFYNLLRSKMVQ